MKEKDKISYLFEEAVTSFNQGDYRSAIQAWEKILEYDPGNAQASHGIRIARERVEAEDAGGQETEKPAAPAPPAKETAPPQPPAETAASGGEDLEGFDFGDDLGDPFGESGASGQDLSFDVGEETPAPPKPEPSKPDEAAVPPSGDALDAWGLPSEETGESPVESGATMAMGSEGAGEAPSKKEDTLPPLDDIGDLLEEEPAQAVPGEASGGGDEFGWGEEPAASAEGGGEELGELEDLGDFGDLGSVGDLEDLDLPGGSGGDESFSDRPEADTIPPSGSDDLEFEGGDEDIGLGPPPPPPVPDEEEDEDIEDLEPEDLGLEPDTSSIPLATPIPAPSIPMPAPSKSGGAAGLILAVIVLAAVIGGGGWFAMMILGGGSDNGGTDTDATTSTATTSTPVPAGSPACSGSILAWSRGNVAQAAEKGQECMNDPKSLQADKARVQEFLPAALRLQERPVDFSSRYFKAVYRDFCRTRDLRSAFETLTALKNQYPQHADELDPFINQIYFNYGVEQLQSNDPRGARDMFQNVLDYDPDDQEAEQLLRLSVQYSNAPTDSNYSRFVNRLAPRREGCIE